MTQRPDVPTDTKKRQERASDPAASAWVSANAGAGKTTVLVRRVIRLLLDGNPPARILCLTFTKAAAANMANKVLETLSNWVRLDDDALDAAIRAVSNRAPTPALRATARRLFAQALETPGGLKVQTIHAFCDRVLHQFPMEARVQAGFEVLDEVQEDVLLRRAREAVLIAAANEPTGALGRALATAVEAASDDSLDKALTEAVRGRRKRVQSGSAADVERALGIARGHSVAALTHEILNLGPMPRSEWEGVAAVLKALGGNAAKCGEVLRHAAKARDEPSAADAYLALFFTKEGEVREDSGFGSKKVRDAEPDLYARLFAERDRLILLREQLLAARALERTAALLVLARAVIDRFDAEKRARGALDYSDLIEKTADMLRDTGAAWVLYKLDGGIDHVLIDEAQDTSPEQWSVIERLTEEFFAGRGAREDRERTIFVVGDEKQSIFSFQGADPRLFGAKRDEFARRVTEGGGEFRAVGLLLSFRSAHGVLQAVDEVFKRDQASKGLTSDGKVDPHEAIRRKAPALVEIWDTEKVAEEDDSLPWDAPLDARSQTSPVEQLAQRIAAAVKFWTRGGLAIEDRMTGELRAPRAGDVIVLVRRRGPLFDAVLQALKKADVRVAGADRLKLHEHIAVMDLLALGDALTLEADDLALACVLKSPLFGLDEDDLFKLAHGRAGSLAASLAAHAAADGHGRLAAAAGKLALWRREAASLRPFDFYSRVLGRDRGRELMLARLGREAADALDEFLTRALAYEQIEAPSIAGFVNFLRRAGTEVKRDLEVQSDAVRVMTVHGAKGLEAPVVVLADTTTIPDGTETRLHDLPGSETFVWATRKNIESAAERAARDATAELREAEYRRLLYVALTRAADALIVCGHEGRNAMKEGCWYRLVRDALEAQPLDVVRTQVEYAREGVLRWRPGPAGKAPASAVVPTPRAEAKPWLRQQAPSPTAAPKRIVPSQFDPDDEPASPYAPASAALDPRRRGDLMHRLLHHLPDISPDGRRAAGARLLASIASDVDAAERDKITNEALRVIEHADLAELFGPHSRAEIDLRAQLREPSALEIIGRIDRLAVTRDRILIADFKTGRPTADAPIHYVRQLAIYCELLARIYPGRDMQAMLVWTAGPAIHKLEAPRLKAALAEVFSG